MELAPSENRDRIDLQQRAHVLADVSISSLRRMHTLLLQLAPTLAKADAHRLRGSTAGGGTALSGKVTRHTADILDLELVLHATDDPDSSTALMMRISNRRKIAYVYRWWGEGSDADAQRQGGVDATLAGQLSAAALPWLEARLDEGHVLSCNGRRHARAAESYD